MPYFSLLPTTTTSEKSPSSKSSSLQTLKLDTQITMVHDLFSFFLLSLLYVLSLSISSLFNPPTNISFSLQPPVRHPLPLPVFIPFQFSSTSSFHPLLLPLLNLISRSSSTIFRLLLTPSALCHPEDCLLPLQEATT